MRNILIGTLLCISCSAVAAQSVNSPILKTVRDRGALICGVDDKREGFAQVNSLDEYSGFSVDLCSAIAAAVFAGTQPNEYRIELRTGTDAQTFSDLREGNIDVAIRNTTWTLSQDASVGAYTGTHYFDGQGFMVWKRSRVRNALELDNLKLCVQRDSLTESVARQYFATNRLRYVPVAFPTREAAVDAYTDGRCDAITDHQSILAALKSSQADSDAHSILGAILSKEPSGAVVRANDAGWENVVSWSLHCMINAEELGVTRDTIGNINASDPIEHQRLAGLVGDFGPSLGLEPSWCADIISAVGNYGESHARHLGANSALNLPRGFNHLWTNGGLIFAPPMR